MFFFLGCLSFIGVLAYLFHVNKALSRTPEEVQKAAGAHWTASELKSTYERLRTDPFQYKEKLPPKLDRRYIVTGGAGFVGGYIVLQLLECGTPAESIRIVDIRAPDRADMLNGPAAKVAFVKTDISSKASVDAAFALPWPSQVAHLPLTVFHTAAVILASERSKYQYGFPEAVNVTGTKNILAAAQTHGASIFSSTSSGSIPIRPVQPFLAPWSLVPRHFWQVLDTSDFSHPLRSTDEFFGNYPRSKALAERLVCAEDRKGFRTGSIRPAHGVYGNPTDNTVGDPLNKPVFPTWVFHIVQSFVHGANVAVAHLQREAVLALPRDEDAARYSGRPFVVTDPNRPVAYDDLYTAIKTLSIHPFQTVRVPPVVILLISHVMEIYADLPFRFPFLKPFLPKVEGDLNHLRPSIFSIITHLIANDEDARKDVSEGGLGYTGLLTTLEGVVLEILEWNQEHEGEKERKTYTTSIALAGKIESMVSAGLPS
ncbi:NAD(P)-binding protein [Xylaria sp. FL1777]|nr:NAD(P)-binding protein [Xylaria sp. FL1777]